MLRKRISFAVFVACMENTRLPKCVVFGELMRIAGWWEEIKFGIERIQDALRAFVINADQGMTEAAQNERKLRKTAGQGAGCFMVKWIASKWIASEKD